MLKLVLKRLSLASKVNAKIRSARTKALYRKWCRRYETRCILDDRDRLEWPRLFAGARVPALAKRASFSNSRYFYVGSNWDQDRSGLILGLQVHGEVGVFRGPEGRNELRLPRDTGEIGVCREANRAALESEFADFAGGGPVAALIGQMWNFAMPAETLARIRASGVPVVNIAMDDRHSFHRPLLADRSDGGVAGILPALSLGATAAPECVAWYEKLGTPAVFFPEASDATLFKPVGEPKEHDITFVGANYGFRGEVIASLRRAGFRVTTFGNGWPEGRIPTEAIPTLFSKSRIVLGIGGILHCRDFTALKLRDFDAPMSGSLYLVQENPDLALMFSIGSEIETWRDIGELVTKCRTYLEDDRTRERIASAGRARAVAEHTWSHRFAVLLEQLQGLLGS